MLAALEKASASREESAARLMRTVLPLLIGVVTGDALADERVDLELVLLADASRSIDGPDSAYSVGGGPISEARVAAISSAS